jgi:Na+/H+ antiporter NhaC
MNVLIIIIGFAVYSVVMFLFGRGYGYEECNYDRKKLLKRKGINPYKILPPSVVCGDLAKPIKEELC